MKLASSLEPDLGILCIVTPKSFHLYRQLWILFLWILLSGVKGEPLVKQRLASPWLLQSLLLRLGYQHKVDDEESSIFKWLPHGSRFMVTATSNLAGFSSLTRLISMPISIYLWYCLIYRKVLLNMISYYCVYCTGSPRLLDHQALCCLHRHKIL